MFQRSETSALCKSRQCIHRSPCKSRLTFSSYHTVLSLIDTMYTPRPERSNALNEAEPGPFQAIAITRSDWTDCIEFATGYANTNNLKNNAKPRHRRNETAHSENIGVIKSEERLGED